LLLPKLTKETRVLEPDLHILGQYKLVIAPVQAKLHRRRDRTMKNTSKQGNDTYREEIEGIRELIVSIIGAISSS